MVTVIRDAIVAQKDCAELKLARFEKFQVVSKLTLTRWLCHDVAKNMPVNIGQTAFCTIVIVG